MTVYTSEHRMDDLCAVAPAPELRERMREQYAELREDARGLIGGEIAVRGARAVGLNDGVIYPGVYYPVGTPADVVQRAALDRAPLRGAVRVAVVLVDFSDKPMGAGTAQRFQDLFFSTHTLPHGSVRDYFADVSGGLIDIQGGIVGPYRMPRTLASYAGSDNSLQQATPNARTLADDALTAADPHIDFGPYDNDGNGYVDAFIVVHAGSGAEQTGAAADIWSHKWVLPAERSVDGAKVYAYLTIPEDAKLGVSAHELGHLLFGWPDLYDTDYSSEGIGDWCLMAGGSWGLGGDRPVHPSAWCKAGQGWITVVDQTANADITVTDVKASRTAYRLWKDGGGGTEYFLVENRQQSGFDGSLPGQGLLIWHIDDAVAGNTNENHYKVALMQADGRRDLEKNVNRGDNGDPFPGSAGNAAFTATSNPNSKSYAGAETQVSVTGIGASATAMKVHVTVKKGITKPLKEHPKEFTKEGKEILKEIRPDKNFSKEIHDLKLRDIKQFDLPGVPGYAAGQQVSTDLEARVTAVEAGVQALTAALLGASDAAGATAGAEGEPFIGTAERPQLGTDLGRPTLPTSPGQAHAKALFDSRPGQ